MSFYKYNFTFDPYKELGISYGSIDSEIKAAYRELAKEHHPDRGGDAERFQKIAESYRILSDTLLKNQFDAEREKKLWNSNSPNSNPNEELFNNLKQAAQFVANQFFSDNPDEEIEISPLVSDHIDLTTRTNSSTGISVKIRLSKSSLKVIRKAIEAGTISPEQFGEQIGSLVAEEFLDYI